MIIKLINIIKSNKGVTVIELLITLVLVLIVAGVSYFVYAYMIRGYDNITNHSDLRQSVRFAQVFIEARVSMADSLEILPNSPDADELALLEADKTVIYVDGNGVLKSYNNGITQDLIGVMGDNVSFSLSFTNEIGNFGGKLLGFEVTGTLENNTYTLSSGMYLVNLNPLINPLGIDGDNGVAVVYTLPEVDD